MFPDLVGVLSIWRALLVLFSLTPRTKMTGVPAFNLKNKNNLKKSNPLVQGEMLKTMN